VAEQDLYRILGVSRTASDDEIKKAYRRLAREYHPDRNQSPEAESKFKAISAAFAVLGDAKKKSAYDEFGPDGLRDGFDPDAARNYQQWAGRFGQGVGGGFQPGNGGFGGFGDFEDILGSLFGQGGFSGQGGFGPRTQRRGRNIEQEVTISLRGALTGRDVHLGRFGVTLKIPKGVSDGQKMRLKGKGERGQGGAGDLIAVIRVATPPGFDQDGTDLSLDLPISVLQAMEGAKVDVLTPDGKTVILALPAGCRSGQKLRLRGKGMTQKGGRGNLYVRLMIHVPDTRDEDCLRLAREMEPYYSTNQGDDDTSADTPEGP